MPGRLYNGAVDASFRADHEGQLLLAWKKKWDLLSIRIVGISTIAFVSVFAALTVDDHTSAAARPCSG